MCEIRNNVQNLIFSGKKELEMIDLQYFGLIIIPMSALRRQWWTGSISCIVHYLQRKGCSLIGARTVLQLVT